MILIVTVTVASHAKWQYHEEENVYKIKLMITVDCITEITYLDHRYVPCVVKMIMMISKLNQSVNDLCMWIDGWSILIKSLTLIVGRLGLLSYLLNESESAKNFELWYFPKMLRISNLTRNIIGHWIDLDLHADRPRRLELCYQLCFWNFPEHKL